MKTLLAALLLTFACTGSKPEQAVTKQTTPRDDDAAMASLHAQLAKAADESDTQLSGSALDVGPQVRALVEPDPRPWWEND